ncbi:sodium:proton antiporter [Ectopseudomonas mendocina]|uniref:Sodium:proton antiporter n=1 Tax=Ectopseudomonas mendocina TaxID=300 RepID=A0ABZ2RH86_ECTME
MLDLAAAFITLTTLLTYLNYRFLKLPPAIGVMLNALLLSLAVQGISAAGYPILEKSFIQFLQGIDFHQVLMTWFLPALLFAGALHVNLADLKEYKWPIGFLATVGVVISTFAVGGVAYVLLEALGWQVSFIYCLIFGALISPTDPIAVMGILKTSGAPKPLSMTIVGESLFNDGTAVVAFGVLLGIAALGHSPSAGEITWLLVQEGFGGVLFGLMVGYVGCLMIKTIHQPQLTVMVTLAMVFGGASVASKLHVSAPIFAVVAGLVMGNVGRLRNMGDKEREYVDDFWELVDDILNALLFALIGLELLLLPISWLHFGAAILLGAGVLLCRLAAVAPGVMLLRLMQRKGERQFDKGTIRTLCWGGLRGGVSVALALSLPAGPERDVLVVITYIIVLVSILIQGLTIGPLVRTLFGENKKPEHTDGTAAEEAPPAH